MKAIGTSPLTTIEPGGESTCAKPVLQGRLTVTVGLGVFGICDSRPNR
jgi:hypothetical protein